MPLRTRAIPLPFLAASVIAISGCTRDAAPPTPQASAPAQPSHEITQTIRASSGTLPLTLDLSVSSTDITVADRIDIALKATTPADATLITPPSNQLLEGFNIVSRTERREILPSGEAQATISITLEPFLGGEKTLPSFSFRAVRDAASADAKTEPVPILVGSLAPKDAGPDSPLNAAPKLVALPVTPIPLAKSFNWLIPAAATGAIALGVVGYVVVTRRSRRVIDPHTALQTRLEAIANAIDASADSHAARSAALALSESLRTYLRSAHGIGAAGDSAADTARLAAAAHHFTPADRAALSSLLLDLQHACFAPGAATSGVARALLERTANWVTSTRSYAEARA